MTAEDLKTDALYGSVLPLKVRTTDEEGTYSYFWVVLLITFPGSLHTLITEVVFCKCPRISMLA